jgi:hypothetical protein
MHWNCCQPGSVLVSGCSVDTTRSVLVIIVCDLRTISTPQCVDHPAQKLSAGEFTYFLATRLQYTSICKSKVLLIYPQRSFQSVSSHEFHLFQGLHVKARDHFSQNPKS